MSPVLPERVLVSGASGPIGAALIPVLNSSGYKVLRLTRKISGPDQIQWDVAHPLDPQSVSGFRAVIHLAGESVVGRWTPEKKARIRDSRVVGTRNLTESLARTSEPPKVFISASAVGYYGDRGNEILREDSASGEGFLPEVCREWEAASEPATDAGIRTAHVRIGVVLSPKGGALGQMLPPFRLGLGGRIGSGQQWMSWIEVRDLVRVMLYILENQALQGPFNATAPTPVTNANFTKVLASLLHRPAMFPVPAFALRLVFGEMADEALLASARVEPARLLAAGFQFKYPDVRAALTAALESA